MPFHHAHGRQVARLGTEQADDDTPVFVRTIERSQIVVTLRGAFVDGIDLFRGVDIDHFAEWREGGASERLDPQCGQDLTLTPRARADAGARRRRPGRYRSARD